MDFYSQYQGDNNLLLILISSINTSSISHLFRRARLACLLPLKCISHHLKEGNMKDRAKRCNPTLLDHGLHLLAVTVSINRQRAQVEESPICDTSRNHYKYEQRKCEEGKIEHIMETFLFAACALHLRLWLCSPTGVFLQSGWTAERYMEKYSQRCDDEIAKVHIDVYLCLTEPTGGGSIANAVNSPTQKIKRSHNNRLREFNQVIHGLIFLSKYCICSKEALFPQNILGFFAKYSVPPLFQFWVLTTCNLKNTNSFFFFPWKMH
ncbi:hypothetical protein EGR_10517 [Echinococcus granulosus]|uniref:Uncharacterized protein n=1 Tax=Echinococcus granulosus TaxID=6210 RepID=W6UMA1_ECHGR|nr:hypothetical protein EGR_10517 [Echinococcus granulosus]EUB54624.1 hypothetical protein EGR_10517 [Echinococcus granulosus]